MKEKMLNKINVDENGCWIWIGASHRQGYGIIRYEEKTQLAHRVMWKLCKGEIPEGMKLCHKCDVTSCVNPDHLFVGTQYENVRDAVRKGKFANRKQGKRRNKLNFKQVEKIKALSLQGMTRKELEKKFKVGQTCIAKILTGVSWKINWDKEF